MAVAVSAGQSCEEDGDVTAAAVPPHLVCSRDRVAEAWGGGLAGYLKSAKVALLEAVAQHGACDGVVVLAPEHEDLPVEILGAPGPTPHANGVYLPTKDIVGGRTAYCKHAGRGETLWLCYNAVMGAWHVQAADQLNTNSGILTSPPSQQAHPLVLGRWSVFKEGNWRLDTRVRVARCEFDVTCSIIGAAYDALVERRARGRAASLSVPVLRMSRLDFQRSRLAPWLESQGVSEEALLFLEEVSELLALPDSGLQQATEGPLPPPPPPPPGCGAVGRVLGAPGALGCRSAAVAARLLARAADLAPAERSCGEAVPPTAPRPFATGASAEDPTFFHVLRLLREGIMLATGRLDPALKGVSWCDADADTVAALAGVLAAGEGGA